MDRIKTLRELNNLTQTDLAKRLNISRSAVNAWEMGISIPSSQNLIELSNLFNVSVDYILGIEKNNTIDVAGLGEEEFSLVYSLIKRLKCNNVIL